jgi:dienelactone hydrolase
MSATLSPCCLKGFEWDGTPTGHISKLASNDTYVVGANPDRAIMLIHDALGWTFPNVRLLADHYAAEADATVYVPDFFGGEVLPFEPITSGNWHLVDVPSFIGRNTRDIREPEILACAKALRSELRHKKIGAVGFCFGGWAVFRLGAREHSPPLVDCISAGHPTWLTKEDISGVGVPVQVLAPEIDSVYTAELKSFTFETIPTLGVPFDYQHFPGVEHACFIRGDREKAGERQAMARAKNAVVGWCSQFLRDGLDG